jgi:nucleoside-diphosphate-sugar epimerase
VVPNFCTQAIKGKPITIYGTGNQTRSFCFVDDLVNGLILLMETEGLDGEVVNLGNPDEHTILHFAERVIALTGSTAGIICQPLPTDDPQRRKPDIAKARELLGWQPATSLDVGLAKTIQFFREGLADPDTPKTT